MLLVLLLYMSTHCCVAQSCTNSANGCPCKKILCLHGGGQTVPSFKNALADIMTEGHEFQFVFARAPNQDNLWIEDPPNSKNKPTLTQDQDSLQKINNMVTTEGPFYAILGYSQGTAILLSYLSLLNSDPFQKGVAFCAYIPTKHEEIANRIQNNGPYLLPMFAYSGGQDFVIPRNLTDAYANQFVNPVRAHSDSGGHFPPKKDSPEFNQLFQFLRPNDNTTCGTSNATSSLTLPWVHILLFITCWEILR